MYKNYRWATIGALAYAVAVCTLQMTVVVPMLPVLQQELREPITSVSWVLTASLLASAVAIPLLSRLGDLYGRRPVALSALGLLVAGSVLAALATAADSLSLLVAGRVLQGLAAPLLPLGMGIARETMSRAQLPSAIGVLSAMMGVGSGGGMVVAGLVGSSQTLFWILAGLGAVGFVLVAAIVREPGRPEVARRGRPDLLGAALVAGWLVCLLLAISQGASWGWISLPTLGLLAAAVVLAYVWVLTARRTSSPLIEIPMLTHRATVGATVASALLGFALFAVITTLSAVAQSALHASVLQVGFYLTPTAVLMLVTSLLAGALIRRYPAAYLVGAGSLFVGAAALWLTVAHAGSFDLYVAATILGIGIGLGYAGLGTMAVEHVESGKTAAAGGVNSLVRIVGSSLAGAIAAPLLANGHAGWSFGMAAITAVVSALFAFVQRFLTRVQAPVPNRMVNLPENV